MFMKSLTQFIKSPILLCVTSKASKQRNLLVPHYINVTFSIKFYETSFNGISKRENASFFSFASFCSPSCPLELGMSIFFSKLNLGIVVCAVIIFHHALQPPTPSNSHRSTLFQTALQIFTFVVFTQKPQICRQNIVTHKKSQIDECRQIQIEGDEEIMFYSITHTL